jgi:hypothetical protein
MKKYYKRGDSIYSLDMESDTIICTTFGENNKGVVHTSGYYNSSMLMNNSFSASLHESDIPRGGYPTLESNEEEFVTATNAVLQVLNQNLI